MCRVVRAQLVLRGVIAKGDGVQGSANVSIEEHGIVIQHEHHSRGYHVGKAREEVLGVRVHLEQHDLHEVHQLRHRQSDAATLRGVRRIRLEGRT